MNPTGHVAGRGFHPEGFDSCRRGIGRGVAAPCLRVISLGISLPQLDGTGKPTHADRIGSDRIGSGRPKRLIGCDPIRRIIAHDAPSAAAFDLSPKDEIYVTMESKQNLRPSSPTIILRDVPHPSSSPPPRLLLPIYRPSRCLSSLLPLRSLTPEMLTGPG